VRRFSVTAEGIGDSTVVATTMKKAKIKAALKLVDLGYFKEVGEALSSIKVTNHEREEEGDEA
jgi:hypothetical protein